MARRSRNRYREMESLMTKIILADVLVFILYLVCAGLSWNVLKVITAIIAIFGSLLCVGWLYLTGEITRRRSLWMVTAFICIAWWYPCCWATPAPPPLPDGKKFETTALAAVSFLWKAPQENTAVLSVRNVLFVPALFADRDILLESLFASSFPP